ncbi:MAG: 5-formyltetrahydrofolate cyclo-ligase [Actinobacteria bacterium]|nr:5-formyltetrahydrofolate cyclo-ligase [Actinomycetota bacterium]
MVISENKSQLRKRFRKERADRFSEESWIHIISANEIRSAKNIATYLSYEFEPNTQDINRELIGLGKNLYLPRVRENKDIEWVKWDGSQESLRQNGKIFEPQGDAEEAIDFEVIIVPALHIDRSGNRLGQGGGSYDRALAKSNAWKIALLHHGEITNEILPLEPHDQKVSAAATPEIIVRF